MSHDAGSGSVEVDGTLGRRDILKGAAAAGAIAWTAPKVLSSSHAHAAGTLMGCYRLQYAWSCPTGPGGAYQCQQIFGNFYDHSNFQCCDTSGAFLTTPDVPGGSCWSVAAFDGNGNPYTCVPGNPPPNGVASLPGGQLTVRFSITCNNCRLSTPGIAYQNPRNNCGQFTNQQGSSVNHNVVNYVMTGNSWPVFFQMYLFCRMNTEDRCAFQHTYSQNFP